MYTIITTIIAIVSKTPPTEIYSSQDNVIMNHREAVLRLSQII